MRFDDLDLHPRPTGAKLWVASGITPLGIKRVAAWGDAWMPSSPSPDEITLGVKGISGAAPAMGRSAADIMVGSINYVCLDEDRERAEALARATLDERAKGYGGGMWTTDATVRGAGGDILTEIRKRSLTGTLRDISAKLDEYDQAGVRHLVMKFIFSGVKIERVYDTIRKLAEEVLPSFRSH